MADKSPAFQFYPADYLADAKVQFLTSAQEGIYIRLLCYCWREGTIPSDADQALMSCKRDAKKKDVEYVLQNLFTASADEKRLIHPRLEKERAKQAEFSRKASEAGRKSAAKRQRAFNGRSTGVEFELKKTSTECQPEFNSSSSSSDIPPNPRSGGMEPIDEFNEGRRPRSRYKKIGAGERKELKSIQRWVASHSEDLIPRDQFTFSKIFEAAASPMSELDFYRAVERFAQGACR